MDIVECGWDRGQGKRQVIVLLVTCYGIGIGIDSCFDTRRVTVELLSTRGFGRQSFSPSNIDKMLKGLVLGLKLGLEKGLLLELEIMLE